MRKAVRCGVQLARAQQGVAIILASAKANRTTLQILQYSNAFRYTLSVTITISPSPPPPAVPAPISSPCIIQQNIMQSTLPVIRSQLTIRNIIKLPSALNQAVFLYIIAAFNKIKTMFNRHTYERYESLLALELKKEDDLRKFTDKRRKDRIEKTEMYKERVRDFLVKMASKPLELGQYIPPVNHITRINDQTKNLANAQLYINGFKTNKERLERATSENKILDYTPIPVSALNHEFRSRLFDKEIQPGMRFQGTNSPKSSGLTSSRSVSMLPPIHGSNPETKMHFKGIEEMGNKLKSMSQKDSDRIGLINKLQTVYGGGDINLERASLEILQKCKLNKSKTLKTLKSIEFKTEKSV